MPVQAVDADLLLAEHVAVQALLGHRLLAAILPGERVFVDAGKHDWPTWRRLWGQFLSA